MPVIVIIGLIVLIGVAWLGWRALRRRRRAKLFRQPIPAAWRAVIERNVPLYHRLPEQLRGSLHGLVNIFLDEKRFVGCGGFSITDEVRATIAGNAAMLLLGGERRSFRGFETILVYPDTYVARDTRYEGFVEVQEDSVRSGESWPRGPVVLAWSDIVSQAHHGWSGRNVVIHEFAHKLDEENDIMDGLPVLSDRSHYADWAKVLGREYASLRHQVRAGAASVLDPYGAVSPAEFFAVATEAFFETPELMKEELPDLYEQLGRFYNLDPAAWKA
ncbi:MAG: M90 family metallopeptidase [Arenicellales bacterium]